MSPATRSIRLLLPLSMLAAPGCGNEVVVNSDDGSGGSTSGTGASNTGASGSGASGTGAAGTGGSGGAGFGGGGIGGGIDCGALEAEMLGALGLATACDPNIDVPQCTGATIAKTYCDCAVVANDMNPDEAAESFALGDLWYQSCEYNFCEGGCYPTDAPWYCDPATHTCQPAYE